MEELEQLQQTISALEAQRGLLGDAVVDTALRPLQEKLAAILPNKQPEQQRKLATLLFMDIAGHTAQTHNWDPEELMEVIDRAISRMAEAVVRHEGKVVRYQGDGFKAVFGMPTAQETDPENAIRAAIDIQQTAHEIAAELESSGRMSGFSVRVGVATGLVLAGGGSEGEDAVMGEPVNLAARMESSAQPGTILIAHPTYQHVRGVFDVEPLGPIQVKGFSEPVPVYQVVAAKPRTFRTRRRGVEGVETRMVGREAEFHRLKDHYTAVEKGGKRVFVTIVGEPGYGKSRLMYEFESWVSQEQPLPKIFHARARHETQRLPYGMLRDLFAREFEIYDSDNESAAKEKLETGIARVGYGSKEHWAPFIGQIIGFDFTGSPHLSGILDDSQQIRDLAFFAVAQLMMKLMEDRPVLILLEDIHWADDSSLDFLEYLAHACPNFPLLMLCATRNTLFERRPDWGVRQDGWIRMDLEPLSESDSELLVAEILKKVGEIPASLHDLIVRQAEGNPFYVEEVIKMLIDDGVIVPGENRWQVNEEKFSEGKIPQTLVGVLQARLDGLPPDERIVLHRASVAGRIFWDDLTAHMRDPDTPMEDEHPQEEHQLFSHLQGRELIVQKDLSTFSGTTEYKFKHAILRDVTYERLLKRFRKAYHQQVAEWLRDHSGDRVSEYAGQIGDHYEQAGEDKEAAAWFATAGKAARESYAPEAARDYYQKALAGWEKAGNPSAVSLADKAEVYQGLGQVLNWLGQYGEAEVAFQAIVEISQSQGNSLMEARAWHGVSEARMHRGDLRAALESASREEELARSIQAQPELARALWMQAWGAFRLGEMENALSLAQQVSTLSQALQDPDQMAHSDNLLGILASTIGKYSDARSHFEEALSIFRKLGNRRRAMPLMNNLGVIAEARGDYQEALEYYQEALNTAREIGNRDGEMVYLSNLGSVKVRLERFSAGEVDLRLVIEMAGSGGQDVLPTTYSFLAKACLGQGRLNEALEAAQYALQLAQEMESPDDLGLAWRALGRVLANRHEPLSLKIRGESQPRKVGAEECFVESERIFQEIEREDERARTLCEWAKYRLAQGDHESGSQMWEEARQIFLQLGAHSEAARMEEMHAKVQPED